MDIYKEIEITKDGVSDEERNGLAFETLQREKPACFDSVSLNAKSRGAAQPLLFLLLSGDEAPVLEDSL